MYVYNSKIHLEVILYKDWNRLTYITSMVNEHCIQFNNYLVELIKKLQLICPEQKKAFAKYYKYYRSYVDQEKRAEFISEFITYLSKYNKEIETCDEGLFSEEEGYYPKQPIQLLKAIDFKPIWTTSEMTETSKTNLWKYFQTLYLVGTYALKEEEHYQELLQKQSKIIETLIQNFKNDEQIKKDAEKMDQAEAKAETNTAGAMGLGQLGAIFEGNNIITQIAKDVATEMTVDGTGQDPAQLIKLLFGQD